jgi:hypothetical protein
MIHAYNASRGLKDVGRNSYHNKKFSSECSRVGAFVVRHKSTGWSIMSLYPPRNATEENSVIAPEEKSSKVLVSLVDDLIGSFDWELFYKGFSFLSASKDYTYKYTCECPPPYNSIRSGRGPSSNTPIRARCVECGSMFTCKIS